MEELKQSSLLWVAAVPVGAVIARTRMPFLHRCFSRFQNYEIRARTGLYHNVVWGFDIFVAFLGCNTNYSFAERDAALPDTSLFHHRTVFDAVYSECVGYGNADFFT